MTLALMGAGPVASGVPPIDPSLVAGLYAHFKADAITGKVDADALSQWDDSSGNGHHLLQATGGAQPTYRTAIRNGRPGVLFDGIDDTMAAAIAAQSARTLIIVAKATADTNARNLLGLDGTNGEARLRINAGSGWSWVYSEATVTQAVGGAASTTPQIITIKVPSAASAVFYMNGVQTATFDPFDKITTGTSLVIGSATAAFFPGYVFEAILWSAAISDSDHAGVISYLKGKWGI